MPTVKLTDIADRLEEMATALIQAPDPRPLGAYDGYDLRKAAEEIKRLREGIDAMLAAFEYQNDRLMGCVFEARERLLSLRGLPTDAEKYPLVKLLSELGKLPTEEEIKEHIADLFDDI